MSINLLEQIEKDVQEVKDSGQKEINVDQLLKYLAEMKAGVAPIESLKIEQELARYKHERNIEQYKVNNQFILENAKMLAQMGLEMFKSVITTGQTALQSAILINGGAAVALLTFIGGMWAKGLDAAVINPLVRGVSNFALGALIGVIATGATYICQCLYGITYDRERTQLLKMASEGEIKPIPMGNVKKAGIFFHLVAVIAGGAAYYLFWQGLNSAFAAISNHFK